MIEVVFVFAHENEPPFWSDLEYKAFALDGRELKLNGDNPIPSLVILREKFEDEELNFLSLLQNITAYGIEHDYLSENIVKAFNDNNIKYRCLWSFNHHEHNLTFVKLVNILSNYANENTEQKIDSIRSLYEDALETDRQYQRNSLIMKKQIDLL